MMVDMEVAKQEAKRVTCRDNRLPTELDMACRDSNACQFTYVNNCITIFFFRSISFTLAGTDDM